MRILKYFFLFLFAFLFFSCSSTSSISKNPKFESVKFSESTYFLVADINYPQFIDSRYEKLNNAIQKFTDSDYNEFKKLSKKYCENGMSPYSYSLTSEISQSKNILSVLMKINFYSGGAHSNYKLKSFSFDMDKQKFINITDVTGLSLNELSKKCQKLVEAKVGECSLEGVAPKIENFNTFMVNGNDVVVYFEPYQVACFAAGIVNITLPKKM